jgi:hypothetical protein
MIAKKSIKRPDIMSGMPNKGSRIPVHTQVREPRSKSQRNTCSLAMGGSPPTYTRRACLVACKKETQWKKSMEILINIHQNWRAESITHLPVGSWLGLALGE